MFVCIVFDAISNCHAENINVSTGSITESCFVSFGLHTTPNSSINRSEGSWPAAFQSGYVWLAHRTRIPVTVVLTFSTRFATNCSFPQCWVNTEIVEPPRGLHHL